MEKTNLFENESIVKLIDFMGIDNSIARAARVSTGKSKQGTVSEEDKKLIFTLMKNNHTSPFEQVELKFYIKMPIFVARQIMRHRTASINELSGRYSELETLFYLPEKERIRTATLNKGTNESFLSDDQQLEIINRMKECFYKCSETYKSFLEQGLSRELARIILPVGLFTEIYFKIDLHNFFKFIKLRNSIHAQEETRYIANKMFNLVKDKFPIACSAFEEYNLDKN